jgi:preprotein translocase subunit SecB
MGVQTQSRISFLGMDIYTVNFRTEKPCDHASEIILDVTPRLYIPKHIPNAFNIVMEATIECDGFFKLELTANGRFLLKEDLEEKIREIFMHQNAPAMLFPYLRAFVTTFTSNLGEPTGTLILPPQMFSGQLEIISPSKGEVTTEDTKTKVARRVLKKASKK